MARRIDPQTSLTVLHVYTTMLRQSLTSLENLRDRETRSHSLIRYNPNDGPVDL